LVGKVVDIDPHDFISGDPVNLLNNSSSEQLEICVHSLRLKKRALHGAPPRWLLPVPHRARPASHASSGPQHPRIRPNGPCWLRDGSFAWPRASRAGTAGTPPGTASLRRTAPGVPTTGSA